MRERVHYFSSVNGLILIGFRASLSIKLRVRTNGTIMSPSVCWRGFPEVRYVSNTQFCVSDGRYRINCVGIDVFSVIK